MRIVLQRVTQASVRVDGETVGAIDHGLVALVGAAMGDTTDDATRLAAKTAHLRVFAGDGRGGERSVLDVGGGVLVISQFTLLADTRRGNRPSWSAAAAPEDAAPLVDAYAGALAQEGVKVATGRFGAQMTVDLTNNGPLTILLDSAT
jgi:D-tyrosyl-tRNA(Tyr) deacylase